VLSAAQLTQPESPACCCYSTGITASSAAAAVARLHKGLILSLSTLVPCRQWQLIRESIQCQ